MTGRRGNKPEKSDVLKKENYTLAQHHEESRSEKAGHSSEEAIC
jgi:hypothetical protein